MGVLIDLTGHVYGSLTVVARDEAAWELCKGRKWICDCACGRRVSVHAGGLRSGRSRSCGSPSALHVPRPLHVLAGVPDRIVGGAAGAGVGAPVVEAEPVALAVPKKRGPKRSDPLNEPRRNQTLFVTDSEYRLLKGALARVRRRRWEVSILAMLRRSGVELDLAEAGDTVNVSNLADDQTERDAQIEAIRAQKPLIIAALLAERFSGPGYEHSYLAGGVLRTYQQAARAHDAGIAPEDCRELIGMLDGFLESLDELGYCSLPDALALYVQKHPAMAAVIARINAERSAGLTGVELAKASADTFGVSSRAAAKPTFDAAALFS